ncbi:PREDICTED: transcription factor bHLH95-like [Lupinus angustifolius]|uniref:transcription factor bHLH95-like n=1 Tax=Lupinus angustifolius TaxID=3871 RepID=UPI00092FD52F|nr:PREDICTED: transcription factor bHLH95-like [Lupinus angustifolius]
MEDQEQHEIRFSCETHQLSFSNSNNNSKESTENEGGGYIGKTLEKEEKEEKLCESGHEIRKRVKREKRQKTRNLFSTLHGLIPQLPSKVNRINIASEAINYIKSLEQTVQKLEKQKQERLHSINRFMCESSEMVMGNPSNSTLASIPHQPVKFQAFSSPNVVLNIYENEAKFFIYTSKKLNLLTTIAFVLEKFKIEVKCAKIWSKDDKHGLMILAQKNMVPSHQFPNTTSMEDVYKEAAEEINVLIS